jgi:hypothetical protein
MEAQTMDRINAIAIFHVATHRMPHVGSVNTYLILTASLKTELYK